MVVSAKTTVLIEDSQKLYLGGMAYDKLDLDDLQFVQSR